MFVKRHRRRALWVGTAALGAGLLALTACTGASTATTGDPHAKPAAAGDPYGKFTGENLTLSRWAGDPWTSGQVTAASDWNKATGASLKIAAVPYENLHDKQALTMSSGGDFDIVYVHPSWFGEYVKAGDLAPIDSYLSDAGRNPAGFSKDSYLPAAISQGASGGKQYCLPDFISTTVVAYRTDLFEAAGLAAPKTIDDVIADAKALNGKNGVSGIVLPSKRTGAVADVAGSILTAQGNWWYDSKGVGSLNDKAATTAVNFYKEAAKYAPTGLLDMAVDEAATAAAQGKAAIAVDTTPSLSALEDPKKSSTVGKWSYVPLAVDASKPAGELIYWNWCIAANSKHKDAAYSFLQYYTSAEQQAKVALAANTLGATKDFYTNKDVLAKLPFLAAVNSALTNSNPQPSLAAWPKVQDLIETAVQDAMTGTKSTPDAVAAMQAALATLKAN